MYLSFFGINDLPFRSTPDLRYFFNSGSRGDIVQAIQFALDRGDGIVKIVGEVGVGKTTILRKLAYELPSIYRVIYINSPNLLPQDILLFMCHEFGIDVDYSLPKFNAISRLRDFFIENHAMGRKCVIMIDEAQAIPMVTLEEIRLLLNLETDNHKLVQILLFGQPELDANLQKPEIRQFKSRISHSIYLLPLSPKEVESYLNFRMRVAGYVGKDLFSPRIAKKIAKKTGGIIREIHHFADSVLLAAYADNSRIIKTKHLKSDNENFAFQRYGYAGFGMVSVSLVLMGYLFFTQTSISQILTSYYPSSNAGFYVESSFDGAHIADSKSGAESNVSDGSNKEWVANSNFSAYQIRTKILNDTQFVFGVQIIVVPHEGFERVVDELAQYLDRDKLFWLAESNHVIVYYGGLATFGEADSVMGVLPEQFLVGKPFVLNRDQIITRIDRLITSLDYQTN